MSEIETNTREGATDMFGLTEEEMNIYRDLAQDFAVEDVAPKIKKRSQFITPLVQKGEEMVPDMGYLRRLLTDLETIITLTAVNIAHEYAHLQCETNLEEHEVIKHLHNKYEDYVFKQFVKYGIAPTSDIMSEIAGEIILELPFLYAEVIQDENFDEDAFLEERLAAYNDYLNENFSYPDDEEEEDEEEEE